MRVVIDASSLLLPGAGVRNYVHYWVRAILNHRPCAARITTFPLRVTVPPEVDHERSAAGKLGTDIRLNLVRLINRSNPATEAALLGSNLFHSSQHTRNLPRRPKVTATIFDLSCWRTPQYHTAANIMATRQYGDKILKSADGLIAISRHAREDAVEVLRIPPDRIRVIYPGVAESFFHITESDRLLARTKYRIDRPYLLFVGCIEPRKNVRAIVQAYGLLSASLRRDIQMIIAGPFGWESGQLRSMLSVGQHNVRYIGYVPERLLPGLVAGALALVYPSFYEGFGLPAAQAMAAGVPVVGSNRSCLPETIGDGGILVDPDSIEELSAAFDRICGSPAFAAELGSRGRKRALKFRWSVCAADSLQFFRDVAGRER